MNKIIKGIALITIIVAFVVLIPGIMDSTQYIKADEAEWSGSGSTGEEYAFTIVEIAPYKGMGEMGYLIGGQEPVDKELFNQYNASGALSFLGGAIDVYKSYTEKPIPISGTLDTDWKPARTIANQNGYMENVGNANGGRYSFIPGYNYIRVANGTGNYRAEITPGTDMDDLTGWEPTNDKNVNAYFVYGKPAGVTLFNPTYGYKPDSVTKNPSKTGDYDYDSATKTFILNVGSGDYDVIFVRSYDANPYYMTSGYTIVDDNTGDYSYNVNYVVQTGGNYTRETGTLVSTGTTGIFVYDRWNGKYRWTKDDTALTKPNYSEQSGKIWVKNQKVTLDYQFIYNVELVNNEWFKRLSLGIPSNMVDEYPVRVITITPEALSLPANQHYIDEANLFYINANYSHNNSYITLYEKYSQEGLALPYNQKYDDNQNSKLNNLNFAIHDLDWPSTVAIFKRAAGIGCTKAAMIFDRTYYSDAMNGTGAYAPYSKTVTVSYGTDKASSCNLAKLYIMVYQRNMIDFYNSFMNSVTTTRLITQASDITYKSGTTGSYIRQDSANQTNQKANEAVYWNDNTFLPYGLNSAGLVKFTGNEATLKTLGIYNPNMDAQTTDLTNNVLTLNGQDIFTAKFIQPISVPADSQTEVDDHFTTTNPDGTTTTPTTFDLSEITNVITNDGEGFEETGGVSYPAGDIVEGVDAGTVVPTEPVGDGSEGSGLRSYKRVLNIEPTADFSTSETAIRNILSDYDVQIINMTSTQFNGNIEDINTLYDMVYMGSGAGRFNFKNGTTVFNNTALNTKIYFSTGDTQQIKDNGRVTDTYRGNDITLQKKGELQDFLAAGFPIVLDNGMFLKTGIVNTTNIDSFITLVKTSNPTNFLNLYKFTNGTTAEKNIFNNNLENGLKVVRPILELDNPIPTVGATINYIYVNATTDLLTIKFKIVPKGILPSGKLYDSFLYLDKSGDGIYDTTELLDIVSSDGTNYTLLPESKYRTYTYNYNMSSLNGVYQWKLEVRRHDNAQINSIITGYAANTNKKDINILHIIDSSSSYNLQTKVNDTSSLIYQYAGQNKLKDYNLIFNTLTVTQFNALFNVAYDNSTPAKAAATNKLSKYHMIIFDNKTAISLTNALNNIKDEIANGMSAIFTKDSIGYSTQSRYLVNNNFMDASTYNYIIQNKFKVKNLYFIYNSLDTKFNLDSDATYQTTYLTKANEGTITSYPYEISQTMKMASNSYSEDASIDYYQVGNQRLIGWYCLSDVLSPAVKKLNGDNTTTDNYMGMYSSSPNDVKNNYYLFSNGGCYYSGIQLASADTTLNIEEMRLFVNTIIAAYQTTNRIVYAKPVITIINSKLVIEADSSQSIQIAPTDLTGTDFVLKFKIDESSSNMDLRILLDSLDPTGTTNWNDKIYAVDNNGVVGTTAILISNTDKIVAYGTYAVKIPKSSLITLPQPHVLNLTATNIQGNVGTTEVKLTYAQRPLVTLVDPPEIPGATTQYIYVDTDFSTIDSTEGISATDKLRIVFTIANSLTTDVLGLVSEGSSVITSDVKAFPVVAGVESTTAANLNTMANGTYALYIPKSLIADKSSREIIISATDTYGNFGTKSITLLRRSLFPLD